MHQRRDVFERDRPRQNNIMLEGWIVLRFTWDAFVHRPHEIVRSVRAALELAQAQASPAAASPLQPAT